MVRNQTMYKTVIYMFLISLTVLGSLTKYNWNTFWVCFLIDSDVLILQVTEALGNILRWAWGRKAEERWCRTKQGGHAKVLGVSPGLTVTHYRPVALSTCWLPCPSCPTSLVGTELRRWESIRSGQVIISFSSLEAFLALIGGGSMSQWWAAECQTRGRRRNTHRCQTNGLISRPESGMRQISVDNQQEALALFSCDYLNLYIQLMKDEHHHNRSGMDFVTLLIYGIIWDYTAGEYIFFR